MTATRSTLIRRVAAGCSGLLALLIAGALTLSLANQASALTRSTIHLALIEYALALWLMIGLAPADWRAVTPRGRLARWLWTWACLTFLVHVACAFHFTHHWSHVHAFEQTRRDAKAGSARGCTSTTCSWRGGPRTSPGGGSRRTDLGVHHDGSLGCCIPSCCLSLSMRPWSSRREPSATLVRLSAW